jgi:N-acetylglucosamine kinase-like BadF-type ATPase
MGVVLGVDGGNSKTDVVLASVAGEPLAYVRGPGSNSHAAGGSAGCVEVIATLVGRLPFEPPAARAVFFLCGADLPHDIEELTAEVELRGWASANDVDNDTFALLHAGTDRPDAIAAVCGSGINCVGRNAGGRVSRYPTLGWETGDWGGAEALGREALYAANRAADGRGEPTALVALIETHFGKPVVVVGEDVHYRRMPDTRLGEIASGIVALAETDAVARLLVTRLVEEIVLLVDRARRELGVANADVVLGGGMLAQRGAFFELVVAALPAGLTPVVPGLPPVAGAVIAALDRDAAARFRDAFDGWEPHG